MEYKIDKAEVELSFIFLSSMSFLTSKLLIL